MIYQRHESVVNAIRMTNKFYGIATHIPSVTEFPLPDNERGGPDIMVFGESTDACDVTCCSVKPTGQGEKFSSHLKARFDEKMRKYSAFQTLTQYRIVPFVISHLGVVAKETRECISQWKHAASDPQYIFDLYNHAQIALISTQYRMFNYFRNINDKRVLESVARK